MFTVIPAIDIIGGQVVRLTQGDYNQVTHYDLDPVSFAKNFAKHGAKRIHLVDLDGAKAGYPVNFDTVKAIRDAVDCDIELGGGIRSIETIQKLVDIGINYVILGSLFVKDFVKASELSQHFPGKVIAGVDLRGDKIAIEGWTETSDIGLSSFLKELEKLPISALISTEISRDGMMNGPDMGSLTMLTNMTTVPVIASGGVHCVEDINVLRGYAGKGICGCIVGKAILSGKIPLDSISF